jgi:hypothetical protein
MAKRKSQLKVRYKNQQTTVLKALDRAQSALASSITNAIKQLEAYSGIQNYVNTGQLLPELHGWPICPDLGIFLIRRLEAINYDLVIEFGSGASSWIIANVNKNKPFRHLAFDHLEEYINKTAAQLAFSKLNTPDLQLTPLTPFVGSDGKNYSFYNCAEVLKGYAEDINVKGKRVLVLVDGPPASTGTHARYPAMACVLRHFSLCEVDFILDDYIRSDEQEILQKWLMELQETSFAHEYQILRMEKDAALLCILH